MDGGPLATAATSSDLNFRNLLPLGVGCGRGVYSLLPTRSVGAHPAKTSSASTSTWRRMPRPSGRLGDVSYLLMILVVSVVVAAALLAARLAPGELESTRSRVTSGVLTALSLLVTAWRTWILLRQSLATYTTPETSVDHPVRRFSGVLSIFAMNVVTLAHAYTFVTTIDAASVTNTDRDAALLYVFLDSLYDMTLVASGTGFGERVPIGWGAKFVAFVCAAYLTIGMSMTVFARILSSGAMYWGEREGAREGAREGVREGVREGAALGMRKASAPWV
jgi:hypothetical protein